VTAVTPGLGWPAPRHEPDEPDIPAAPSGLGWPEPHPAEPALGVPDAPAPPPAPEPPAQPPDEPEETVTPTTVAHVGADSGRAYRQSLVRDAMANVSAVSRETAPPPPAPVEVPRETPKVNLSLPDDDLAAFFAEDTPIARAAASAVRASRTQPFPKPTHPRLLTVANQKGGVGKTTSAVNLAAALALRGLEVLVIDLDPQGNASTALGIEHTEGSRSIYDVLVGDRTLESVVHQTPLPGLYCAPATVDLAGAEIELVSVVARELRLKRAIAAYDREFDYVFVDCPPSLGLLTVNALVAAQEIVIPIQCEFYALEGLGQLLRNVDLVRSHLNEDLWVSTILLTMYDSRTRLADQVATEVRSHFGDLVLDAAIPRSVRISEAPGYGQTVLTYDPTSRGAQAYLEAAREIADRGARMENR
jgi:chromosome partitioning protein